MRSPELLARCVRRHLPDLDGPVTLEPTPSGHFNDSFFVYSKGHEMVLRVAPSTDAGLLFYERRMMRQEPALHRLLIEKTSVPVPCVIAFDASHQIIPRDFILLERLTGRPLSEARRVNLSAVLKRVGECLAQVHAITATQYGYLGEHRPMIPQDNWCDAFRVMWGLLLKDIRATGHYSSDEVVFMRAMLDKHLKVFVRAIPASLLHMDVWSQNILVEGDKLTGLIDWDQALWGDPEIEFAVLDYCGISRSAFWAGYGRKSKQTDAAQTRHLFYLLYEIQKYIVIDHFRKGDPVSARSYKEQALQLVEQLP